MEAAPPHEGATCPLTFCKTLEFCKLQNCTNPFADRAYNTSILLLFFSSLGEGLIAGAELVKLKIEHAAEAMSYGLEGKQTFCVKQLLL